MSNQFLRVAPSEIETIEKVLRDNGSPLEKKVIRLCVEIRACWAEIAAATEAMRARSDELELLRKVAIAAAEEMTLSPATESPLFDAVREWQKSQREKA